jgi:hypothetical protein
MPHEFLHSRVRIGSCKNPDVNYKSKGKAFHKDDTPQYARDRVAEVKEWASSKILRVDHNPEWSRESKLPRLLCERVGMTNHANDRSRAMQYNFRAEVNMPKNIQPIDKPGKFHISTMLDKEAIAIAKTMREDRLQRGHFYRNQEMPVHPKLVDVAPWASSNVVDSNLKQQKYEAKGERAKKNTSKVNAELNDPELAYSTPYQQSKTISKLVREKKRNGTFTSSSSIFKKEDEKVDRSDFRNHFVLEPSRKFVTHHHSGVWEHNKMDGKMMWSDTGSYIRDSNGDVQRSHNPDGYNFTGPNLAPAPFTVAKEKRINLIEKIRPPRIGLDGEVVSNAF